MSQSTGRPERPTLRRARKERLLFGVCGGIAKYFGLDPTLVRVGFVILGLMPPLGGMLVLAYIVLAIIVPEEGVEELGGRDQVKENISSLRDEVMGLAETVRARITGEPHVAPPATPSSATPVAETPAATTPAETTPTEVASTEVAPTEAVPTSAAIESAAAASTSATRSTPKAA